MLRSQCIAFMVALKNRRVPPRRKICKGIQEKELAVQIMEESLPGIKSFLKPLNLPDFFHAMLVRYVISIVFRTGRNSAMHASNVVHGRPLHRAQPARFLIRMQRWATSVLDQLVDEFLSDERWTGEYVFIVDSTLVAQQGKTAENTYSTGNRKRRPEKNRRYKKYKYARKSCHCFVFGLLITPDGTRVPFFKPYHTRKYAKRKKIAFRTQAQLASDLIRELTAIPNGASVCVLGDTAFDAKTVRDACAERGFHWIVPTNTSRVFAGAKKKRKRLTTRIHSLLKTDFKKTQLTPGSSDYAKYRRLSAHRVGSKSKPRTYYVHTEKREVHSVGQVRLVFSSTKPIRKRASRKSTKILMTNARNWSPRKIVELYSLRWQIELFFKEMKRDLGMHQYQFKSFDAVTSWIEIAILTFLFMEWTRKRKLKDKRLTDEERKIWSMQRTYGSRQAIQIGTQVKERQWMLKRLETKHGIKTLRKSFISLLDYEYRCAA
jgi:hypothetical protein